MVIPILVWVVVGFVLLAAEMVTLTFVLAFFGIGALVVALLKWLLGLESVPVEILIFAAVSVSGLLFLRRKFQSTWSPKETVATDEGKIIFLSCDVPARSRRQIEYQGSTWTAENETLVHLPMGTRVQIVRTDGLTLIIKGV